MHFDANLFSIAPLTLNKIEYEKINESGFCTGVPCLLQQR
jgi:hypothetical protein